MYSNCTNIPNCLLPRRVKVADVMRQGQLRWYRHLKRKRKEDCVSSCREFDAIGVKSKGRGSKTCERFVTHNSQLVNDLEYGDDTHANYFSRHSTSLSHATCTRRHARKLLFSSLNFSQSSRMYTVVGLSTTPNTRVLRSHCQKYTTPLISFSHPIQWYVYIAKFLTQGAYGSNPKKRFFQKRLDQFFRKLTTL